MSGELLLEIGTEEIPAGYLKNGLGELKRLAGACLKENRIAIDGDLQIFGTPRRLVLIGNGIAEKQEDLIREVTGPPKSVAYDELGNPTKAALGFAEKQGVSVKDLKFIQTPKGEYLYIKQLVPGRPVRDILSGELPRLIAEIPWPKSMRWASLAFPFVRPIHWVVALFNGVVIPFEVAGVTSGNITRGHRFMSPGEKEVTGVKDYFKKMEENFVIISQEERERLVEKLAEEAARRVKGKPADDPELLATVANLIEYPSAVCGSFDEEFLKLPEAVLITAMKEHQKYFSVRDEEGKLMCNFVAVNNTVARDESMVQRGHERVLRARLSDAAFFFKEDRKRTLKERLEDLNDVIYQAELGTSYAKVQRFTKLAEYLAGIAAPDKLNDIVTAAGLCKCDLITQMVSEFPGLQGCMGEEYARMEGYKEDVCLAIREHYLPAKAGGQLPESKIGAVVGVADRIDTIAGCFAVGLEPTGSADPFALRRHALAIIRIIEDLSWDLLLREFVNKALAILREEIEFDTDQVFARVMEFFRERYRQMMLRSGYKSDLIEAVISVEFDEINQLRPRIEQLNRFASDSDEFHDLALTFKRISNILKKQKKSFHVNPSLFREPCELALWEKYQGLKDGVDQRIKDKEYYDALNMMVQLRKPVDEFFDGAEIMTKDDTLRENRVGLLQHLAKLFLEVADLSKFSI